MHVSMCASVYVRVGVCFIGLIEKMCPVISRQDAK